MSHSCPFVDKYTKKGRKMTMKDHNYEAGSGFHAQLYGLIVKAISVARFIPSKLYLLA
jgi:hypothetical protein